MYVLPRVLLPVLHVVCLIPSESRWRIPPLFFSEFLSFSGSPAHPLLPSFWMFSLVTKLIRRCLGRDTFSQCTKRLSHSKILFFSDLPPWPLTLTIPPAKKKIFREEPKDRKKRLWCGVGSSIVGKMCCQCRHVSMVKDLRPRWITFGDTDPFSDGLVKDGVG